MKIGEFRANDFIAFEYWWLCAGQELRNELLERLNKVHLPMYPAAFSKENIDFCLDYSNRMWELGDGCVYVWVDDDEGIYYIGSGDTSRAGNTINRTDEFKAINNRENSVVYILCVNVDKDISLEMEKLCIYQAQLNHCPLVNTQWTLTQSDMCKINGIVDGEHEYFKLKAEYPEIADAFDELYKKVCSDLVNGVRNASPKKDRYEPRVYWEIDGVEKPAREWCDEYNMNYSTAWNRMRKYGLTPKQALTFPSIPRHGGYNRRPLDYWRELGLLEGDSEQAS